MFDFNLEEDFKRTLEKISKRSPMIARAIGRKIKEITNRDSETINAYKNLRYDLKEYKRVHVTKHLVMLFKVEVENNRVLFIELKHRDDVYKK